MLELKIISYKPSLTEVINLSQKGKKGPKKPSGDFGGNKNPPRIRKGKKPIGYTERPKTE